jgi:uncharacterized protein
MSMQNASAHVFESHHGSHLLVVDGSRIYDLEPEFLNAIRAVEEEGGSAVGVLLASLGGQAAPYIDDSILVDPPVRSISLAVAQKCNLACSYCYAQGGEFGDVAKSMDWLIARDSVCQLITAAEPGSRVNIAFMGGEPLVNRALIRRVTEYAVAEAELRQVRVGFSITTNGTLVDVDDAAFFEKHGFAVTVSLDGMKAEHDRLRPTKSGGATFDRIVARLKPLLMQKKRMQVSARVTVTPLNLDLPNTLDGLLDLGFDMVGFSPMLSAPKSQLELDMTTLQHMLDGMIACGRKFEAEVTAGRPYPFANLTDALREIHRGSHRPYPCGAGAGYLGVSADGGLFACHRFVEDERGRLGSVAEGIDQAKRQKWLSERHVHRQEPCRSCWARYLCGGGCHHEVIYRGRPACDFIRGWLDYCLKSYVNVAQARPDYFASLTSSP